jgi:D-glycero-alpha-D-manno-heptose 1-phosphate guanylyltransferase
MEAIVLAGGLGTRLRSVITEVPKPMAPVAGRPFLDYILYYLKKEGVTRVVLAVGYKWEVIRDYYADANSAFGLELDYSVEVEPLGTGGAIFKAAEKVKGDNFFIINGDTSFPIPLKRLSSFAGKTTAELAIALKKISNSDRYGSVEHSADGHIISFKEKGQNCGATAEINGGIYFMQKALINRFTFPEKFSFETDFMQSKLGSMNAFAKTFNSTFIDIGIPEDYYRAQKLFKNVINEEI